MIPDCYVTRPMLPAVSILYTAQCRQKSFPPPVPFSYRELRCVIETQTCKVNAAALIKRYTKCALHAFSSQPAPTVTPVIRAKTKKRRALGIET